MGHWKLYLRVIKVKIFGFLKSLLKTTLSFFLAFFLLVAFLVIIVSSFTADEKVSIPNSFTLFIDFDQAIVEKPQEFPLKGIAKHQRIDLRSLINAIESSATDDRVQAIIARVNNTSLSFAQIQEIQEALKTFNQSGKPSAIHTTSFGQVQPGNAEYLLASNFQKIWLQPSGTLNITGFSIENAFFKQALEEWGIKTEVFQRHEYKGFLEFLTREKGFSEPVKQSYQAYLDTVWKQFTHTISENRQITEEMIEQLINSAPHLSTAALNNKMVDHLGYWQNLVQQVSKGKKLIKVADYISDQNPIKSKNKIALIYGTGTIYDAPKGTRENQTSIVSDHFIKKVKKAYESDAKAIVIRIDSPGGSYTAADSIWAAIQHFKNKKNIPTVVSMGGIAASGGYFMAMTADKVVALPTTLTGSIGVIGATLNLEEFFNRLGIYWDRIDRGDNASMWTMTKSLTPFQRTKINEFLDYAYDDFITKVSQSRNIEKNQVDQIAKGRIWSGKDAKENGLVDELGGLNTAINAAKDLAEIGEKKVEIVIIEDDDFSFDMIFNSLVTFQKFGLLINRINSLIDIPIKAIENSHSYQAKTNIQMAQ